MHMPRPSRRKGTAHERDLAYRLFEAGFAVLRGPASGSKVKRLIYPDVVAIYKGRTFAFEVKAFSELRPIYLDARRSEKLLEFAERAGGEAYVAFKHIGSGEWRLVPLSALRRTRSALVCDPKLLERATKLGDFVKRVKAEAEGTAITAFVHSKA